MQHTLPIASLDSHTRQSSGFRVFLSRSLPNQKKDILNDPKGIIPILNSLNINKKVIENQADLDREAKHFEKQVQVFNGIKDLCLQTKPKKDGPNKQKKSATNYKHNLSDLYRTQYHRALQEILIGPTLLCPISADKIEKHCKKILNKKIQCDIHDIPEYLWQKSLPSSKVNSVLLKELTPKEVKSKLMSKIYNPLSCSRSLGLDRITFDDLRKYDRFDYSRMTDLFNACLKLQTVPRIWMEFWSVLVKVTDKDLDNSDAEENDEHEDLSIKNWRSITMQRTISKLFQSLITARLITWAKSTGRLSATQKGFLMHNAACENSFILQECKNHAEDEEKDLVVAWLDFSDASDHIPQSAVLHALNKHSVPAPIIEIIQHVLEFSNTKFRVTGDEPFTKIIPITKGLPQGSPISPILLDLVIEPILRDLTKAINNTFEIYNNKINHYAIPNEMTLVADSANKLQNLLILVEKNAKLVGLKFKINKCSTYHYDGKEKKVKSQSRFLFFGQKLSTLPEEKVEDFFGVKQSLSIGQEGCPTIQEMIENINAIDQSSLKWYQKVESILIYIIPRVENFLKGLRSIDTVSLGKAEEVLKDRFKCWLDLPDNASTRSIVFQVAATKQDMKEDIAKGSSFKERNFKFTSVKQDKTKPVKYHYLPFMELFYIMKIVHALKMLTSQDPIVQKVAFATLMAEVNNMMPNKKKMKITKQHLAQYLSGELHTINKKSDSMWSIVREATLKLKIKIPLKWQYNNGMQLLIDCKDMKRKSILNRRNVNSAEDKLKNALVEYYIDETMKKSSGPEDNLKAIR